MLLPLPRLVHATLRKHCWISLTLGSGARVICCRLGSGATSGGHMDLGGTRSLQHSLQEKAEGKKSAAQNPKPNGLNENGHQFVAPQDAQRQCHMRLPRRFRQHTRGRLAVVCSTLMTGRLQNHLLMFFYIRISPKLWQRLVCCSSSNSCHFLTAQAVIHRQPK
ncbi:unnamed protein product [Durusdinium trenchii]|uniref:Secreted protein n=1 Tax=Durusdinium trenchii TaxID=1381693 RepID=A0ABP0R618_9DINO